MTAQQHQQQQHQDETSTSTSGEDDGGDDHGEVSCCLEDTDSFMLRKREFLFPGLPPGARTDGIGSTRFYQALVIMFFLRQTPEMRYTFVPGTSMS